MKTVAERLWKRNSYLRWNNKIDKMREKDRIARRSRDLAWKARHEAREARYAVEMDEDTEIEASWHNFAYMDDGPTPDWVKTLGDEDPMEI